LAHDENMAAKSVLNELYQSLRAPAPVYHTSVAQSSLDTPFSSTPFV
jgi:hypothetical protein